jgi:peptidoglycan hydrolase CwlO-like protein
MDPAQTVTNALLLAASTTIFWFVTRVQARSLERRLDRHEDDTNARFVQLEAKIDRLDAKIDGVDTRLDSKIDAVRTELGAKIDAVRTDLGAKIDTVRGDITQLAFRLGQPPQPQTG